MRVSTQRRRPAGAVSWGCTRGRCACAPDAVFGAPSEERRGRLCADTPGRMATHVPEDAASRVPTEGSTSTRSPATHGAASEQKRPTDSRARPGLWFRVFLCGTRTRCCRPRLAPRPASPCPLVRCQPAHTPTARVAAPLSPRSTPYPRAATHLRPCFWKQILVPTLTEEKAGMDVPGYRQLSTLPGWKPPSSSSQEDTH